MTKNTQGQIGSAHIVIIGLIVIVLLSVLGYVFWQNFINKNKTEPANDGQSQSTTQSTETAIDPSEDDRDDNEGYIVLQDWGIKFKLPEDSGEVHFYKENVTNENGSFGYYEFSTKRVEELGEQCAPDSEKGPIRLAAINRRDVKPDHVTNAVLINDEPINGYYYYLSGAQSYCANKNDALQEADKSMIEKLLLSLVAIE